MRGTVREATVFTDHEPRTGLRAPLAGHD